MSRTVSEVVERQSESLLSKLSSNLALSNLIMGFLGRMSMEAIKKGRPLEGIEFGDITGSMGRFSFKVIYNVLAPAAPPLTLPSSDIRTFVAARSQKLATVLTRNPRVLRGFVNLIEAVDRYCAGRGKRFSDFKIEKAFITQDDRFVIEEKKEGGRWKV